MATSQPDDINQIDMLKLWKSDSSEGEKLKQYIEKIASIGSDELRKYITFLCRTSLKWASQPPQHPPSISDVIQACKGLDPTVGVLALQSLLSPEESGLTEEEMKDVRRILRSWRCDAPFSGYQVNYDVIKCLRDLNIFERFRVPLFIDNFGFKRLLSVFSGGLEEIEINADTTIYHVTHSEDANKIKEEKNLKPSDNKNAIKGIWFGVPSCRKPLQGELISPYGDVGFKTTLGKLGVSIKNLHQGEIVTYKHEINVILYVEQEPRDDGEKLMIPKTEEYNDEYINVSIFVPGAIEGYRFDSVFEETEVNHEDTFCLKELRPLFTKFKCPYKEEKRRQKRQEEEFAANFRQMDLESGIENEN